MRQHERKLFQYVTDENVLIDGCLAPGQLKDLSLSEAYVDLGPSPAGNAGPYLRAPRHDDQSVRRVYWKPIGGLRLVNVAQIGATWVWELAPRNRKNLDTEVAMLATAEAVKKASAPGPSIKDETEALDDEIQRVRHLAGLV